jgi:Rrf2 family transcriptional regulator, nitric oxide-sensitive transcriptional repressor
VNRLNRKVEYALMALKVMAKKRQGELTSVKEVVDQTGCPFDATAHVLQQMVQKQVLRSEQGAHGGYQLVRDIAKFNMLELMEIIMGPIAVAKCLHGSADCELLESCNIKSPVATLNRKLAEFYQNLSVGDLLRVRERDRERDRDRERERDRSVSDREFGKLRESHGE